MAYNIDDIFTAAVEGNKERLRELLELGEVDINQMLDAGMSNGLHVSYPMLFSVLHRMSENGINYEILDILVEYGIDLDGKVKLSCDAFTRYIPFLFYVMLDWNNSEMVRALLERGAAADNIKEEHYSDGHVELYTATQAAICFCQDTIFLELLLQYGAKPDHYCQAYNQQQACVQTMPLLFYALIDKKSTEKTALLFSYGADINQVVYVGYGAIQQYKFRHYVELVYPQCSGMLRNAAQRGRENPRKPIRQAAAAPDIHAKVDLFDVAGDSATTVKKAGRREESDSMQGLRQCAEKIIDFDWQHRERYRYTKQVCQTEKPGLFGMNKKLKDAEHDLNLLITTRQKGLDVLNEEDRRITGGKQTRWWNSFNGLENCPGERKLLMVWMPFRRIVERADGTCLCPILTDADTITGRELALLQKGGEFSPVYAHTLEPDAQYHIAELCFWEVSDAAEVYRTVTNTYSESEIKSAMQEREQSMNRHEAMLNFITDKGYFTDEERYLFGKMSSNDYFTSQLYRDSTMNGYQQRLREAKTVHVSVENANLYCQRFRPVGVIAFDETYAVHSIFIYQAPRKSEVYLVDQNKAIHEFSEGFSGDPKYDRIHALRSLKLYEIPPADILGQKPDYLSEQEWLEFIYHCHKIHGMDGMELEVAIAYRSAGNQKQQTIQSSRF